MCWWASAAPEAVTDGCTRLKQRGELGIPSAVCSVLQSGSRESIALSHYLTTFQLAKRGSEQNKQCQKKKKKSSDFLTVILGFTHNLSTQLQLCEIKNWGAVESSNWLCPLISSKGSKKMKRIGGQFDQDIHNIDLHSWYWCDIDTSGLRSMLASAQRIVISRQTKLVSHPALHTLLLPLWNSH